MNLSIEIKANSWKHKNSCKSTLKPSFSIILVPYWSSQREQSDYIGFEVFFEKVDFSKSFFFSKMCLINWIWILNCNCSCNSFLNYFWNNSKVACNLADAHGNSVSAGPNFSDDFSAKQHRIRNDEKSTLKPSFSIPLVPYWSSRREIPFAWNAIFEMSCDARVRGSRGRSLPSQEILTEVFLEERALLMSCITFRVFVCF